MKIFDYSSDKRLIDGFLQDSKSSNLAVTRSVEEIIDVVRHDRDTALLNFSNKFDGANFEFVSDFVVSEKEIEEAKNRIKPEVFKALKHSYDRIYSYHKKQLPQDFYYEDEIGVGLGNLWRNIEKVGVYAPGGTASYPSSVLMCAVPAIVAGVKEIVLCAPTSKGKMNDAVLVAADLCGIKKIYKIGGAQAIAALAYGTSAVDKVDKIVGPGNSYVATAKKILFGEVGIDMIAGPTDLTIIADENISPELVAADALSQLEHGADSKVFIITDNEKYAQNVMVAISDLKEKLPRRHIIDESLQNSAVIIVDDIELSAEIANKIAPEHLEIACKNPQRLVKKINNAGAIFLGNYTPESIGDYIAGPSHTLPTNSTARFASGLSVYDFLKRVSLMSCSEESFLRLADDTMILAESEGLDAHKLCVELRKK